MLTSDTGGLGLWPMHGGLQAMSYTDVLANAAIGPHDSGSFAANMPGLHNPLGVPLRGSPHTGFYPDLPENGALDEGSVHGSNMPSPGHATALAASLAAANGMDMPPLYQPPPSDRGSSLQSTPSMDPPGQPLGELSRAQGGSFPQGGGSLPQRTANSQRKARDSGDDEPQFARSGSEASGKAGVKEEKVEAKESQKERSQQRKARRREKDWIEDLQASIDRVGEEMKAIQATNVVLSRDVADVEEQLASLRGAESSSVLPAFADEELAARFSGDMVISIEDPPLSLGPDQVSRMSKEELAGYWAGYISRMGQLLQGVEAQRDSPPERAALEQRLDTLQREAVLLYIRVAVTAVGAAKRLASEGIAENPQQAPAPLQKWGEVASVLGLAQRQALGLGALWRSFEARTARVLEARAGLHSRLQDTLPNCLTGRDFAVHFLKAHEIMDGLKHNLRQEHVILCDFVNAFHQVLLPLQNAACIVRSAPYFPDTIAICMWAAARAGFPDARERITQQEALRISREGRL